jgi:hypothetical protein
MASGFGMTDSAPIILMVDDTQANPGVLYEPKTLASTG